MLIILFSSQGDQLTRLVSKEDYTIIIGKEPQDEDKDKYCTVLDLTENSVSCKPSEHPPERSVNSTLPTDFYQIIVSVSV